MRQRAGRLKLWKKRPIQITLLLFGLFCLYCLVRIATPYREYLYEGSHGFEPGTSAEEITIYGGISLPPGIYRIELEYDTDTDLAGLCNVADGSVVFGALLSNGEHLYEGLSATGYDIWLYERTENLQVTVTYEGDGKLTTGNLRIIETGQLWTMLLTAGSFFCAVICLLLAFYYYDKEYPISREKKNAFFFVMLIGLAASIPYTSGYTITGADLTYHLQRIEGVKDGLLGGQFPVRLEPRWLYDHGYANGIFYCNAFLYFPALLRLLGFPVSVSYNLYSIVLNIATAAVSYYCFKHMFGRKIGIIGSALYTLSIFRIYKFMSVSAVGEGTALLFLPLVFYGLYRVFTENPETGEYKTAWIPIMLGYAGLIQSHVLTCEITALATVCFCAVNVRKLFCGKTFWELFKGAAGAVLVSLWYLVPFLDYYITQDFHIKNVSARTIQERGLYPANLLFHFWQKGDWLPADGKGMFHCHPEGVGPVLMGALALFLILWFSGAFRRQREERFRFAGQTALIGAVLLFMSTNAFPWDRIQRLHPVCASLVSSLQFPHRFLGWGTLCLIFLLGICMEYCRESGGRYGGRVLMGAVVFGIMTSNMFLMDYVDSRQTYFELYNEEGMGFGYISGAEYLIEGTDAALLRYTGPRGSEGLEIAGYEKRSLGMDLECRNLTDAEVFADLPLLLYKGYRAGDGAAGRRFPVEFGDNNVVRVLIPACYEGHVRVYFASPFYWRISEFISVGTIGIMLAFRLRRGCMAAGTGKRRGSVI